ncbi:MAG: HEAT repeat domain-containing protein [Treponema sp.]|nr:HEAT repeat domain-containing protein [Treponema sp.]
MKKNSLFICALLIFSVMSADLFAQEKYDIEEIAVEEEISVEEEIVAAKAGIAEIPEAKRPRPIDKEKAEKAAEKDESAETYENRRNTIKYGIPSEIGELMDKLIEEEDPRFTDEIYDVFQVTKSSGIREKVLKYFTKIEDPCLEDYAVELLNDPYDEKNEVVKAVFKYVSAVKTKEAVPAVITLIESENESYFNDAISTLGDIGGPSEALFLIEYLDRDDLSDAQRQSLMRTCGKMHAVETWDKLVDILENEDENTFVRMYAAESIGLMEVDKSVPVLCRNFNATDPNLRQYIIKGLVNFPDVIEARTIIIQGIRDEHWRVRQEAIKAVKEKEIKEAVPYLVYRAKNDPEKVIKEESYTSIAALNTEEGNNYLVEQVTNKKTGDSAKKKIIEVLLKEGHAGEKEILELASECVKDDKKKDLRYAIGKELAKNAKPEFKDICLEYLNSKDTTTVSLGLDMYKNCKFAAAEEKMREIYEDKKANASNKKRIQKMLGIEDEEESKDNKKEADSKENKSNNGNKNNKPDENAK